MGVLSNALFLVALAAAVAFVSADDTIKGAVDDLTTTKSGATWCPVPLVGTQCPDSSIFHYYKCCGDLNKDCCFNLQVWVIVVLAVIGVILIAGFVLSLVRCIFCR